jgi:hypothetical protein
MMRIKDVLPRQPRPSPRPWLPAQWLAAAATGAAFTYFLDPEQGAARRATARDRFAALMRRGARGAQDTARGAAAEAYGLAQQARHIQPEHWSVPNDATLTQRVESELFRDPRMPKGRISINAEAGIVVLRGELDRPEQIRAVEEAVERIAGVRGVHNLLHLAGTPAPDRGSVLPAP